MEKRNNPDRPSDVGGVALGPTGSNGGGANEVVVDHSTVHRDDYISSSSPYKSPGEMVPFTSTQWKELERQAMIYKYMISSVPVPPHLLPCVETGRCKRTDGKKWRCSRDVAPHHKYCERHLHRGRPRSRKPVEQVHGRDNNGGGGDENNKKPRLQQNHKQFAAANDNPPLACRELGSTMESEMVAIAEAEQKWHHLLETDDGSSIYCPSSIFHQDYNVDGHPSDHVLPYSDFCASEIDSPIYFIDTNDLSKEYPLSTNYVNFCPWLNLSISMAGVNALDGEYGNVRMRGGDDFYNEGSICSEAYRPGGPLAEALCGNRVSSPQDWIGGMATTVSSSSEVLRSIMPVSYSDGSV